MSKSSLLMDGWGAGLESAAERGSRFALTDSAGRAKGVLVTGIGFSVRVDTAGRSKARR